jgi:hypothetical protein
MPVTTRAAALRSQTGEEIPLPLKPVVTNKTTRKCRPQKKRKKLEE